MSEESSHADLALAFCREVLGWEDAESFCIGEAGSVCLDRKADATFCGHNPAAVMAEARSFCMRHGLTYRLTCTPQGHYAAHVVRDGVLLALDESHPGDPCAALMGACLAARRKLGDAS